MPAWKPPAAMRVLDSPDAAKVAGRWRAAGGVISSTVHEWQVWLVTALLLFVAEMLAPGFWLLSVAVGCVLAGVVSLVLPGFLAPLLSFAAGTLLSLVGVRPFLLRHIHPPSHEIKTNVDALVGRVGVVSELIDKPRAIDWHQVIVTPAGDSFARHFRTDKIDLRETVYVFPRQNVITKDNVVVEIDALIYSQITDPVRATYEIANLPDAIEKLTQTTLRNVIGEMELDHVLSSRDTINAKLREILDEATHKWGAKVSRVELKDINPPRDIRDAMEKQMRAERDRRAAILTAEAEKQSRTLQAEGIRQSEINQAEGQKQAKILAAEAEANARLKVAEAEAQAIERITTAIKGTGGDPARYLIAIRYIEALKDMVTSPQSNKVIYVPYEATGVLSSLGGIREMLAGPSDKGEERTGAGRRARRSRSRPHCHPAPRRTGC